MYLNEYDGYDNENEKDDNRVSFETGCVGAPVNPNQEKLFPSHEPFLVSLPSTRNYILYIDTCPSTWKDQQCA